MRVRSMENSGMSVIAIGASRIGLAVPGAWERTEVGRLCRVYG